MSPTALPPAPALGGGDRLPLLWLAAGLAALFVPTLWDLSAGAWSSHAQGHELLFAAVSAWLLYQRRDQLLAAGPQPRLLPGLLFGAGLLMYVVGRSQQLLRLEITALVMVLAALVLLCGGRRGLRAAAFPLFFLLLIMPLPYSLVLALTGPLKLAVSAVATQLLFWAGAPVGRSGVVVTIGQYQLLVSEACAGLQTMFTLEAMGLLYASLRSGGSALLNALLAVLVVPVSFVANVIRVIVLMLVTYRFGDAVGQGFVHGFAGLVLFTVALVLIFALDCGLRRLLPRTGSAA
ncbi:exosortase B [Ideonella sp. BN130291]|uniref:exosortase B n=1 Tax=Ideonella sp. BN130291 TaxID=3112940 RepID=UPI002E2566C8|nr:exosortase B [Ideonella sp. BN130291]